jgi:hypothetical protein
LQRKPRYHGTLPTRVTLPKIFFIHKTPLALSVHPWQMLMVRSFPRSIAVGGVEAAWGGGAVAVAVWRGCLL